MDLSPCPDRNLTITPAIAGSSRPSTSTSASNSDTDLLTNVSTAPTPLGSRTAMQEPTQPQEIVTSLEQRPELSHLHVPVPLPGCTSTLCTHLYQPEGIKITDSNPKSSSTLRSTLLTPSELLVESSNQENRHPSRVTYGRAGALERPSQFCNSSTATANAPIVKPSFLPLSFNDNSTESMSSHEKKRHYLECFGHYIASTNAVDAMD
jgi:hypothetical protein